jgi:hypothetical protein
MRVCSGHWLAVLAGLLALRRVRLRRVRLKAAVRYLVLLLAWAARVWAQAQRVLVI